MDKVFYGSRRFREKKIFQIFGIGGKNEFEQL
jgi:hypothetical protein